MSIYLYFHNNILLNYVIVLAAITNSDHIISGEISCGSQYHFYMETHACLCIPKEEGYEVYSSTQWPAEVQSGVAGVMGVPTSR